MVLVDNVHLFHCSFLLDEDALLYEDAFRLIFQCRLLRALLKVFSGYFKFSVLFFSSSISSCLISAVSEKRMRDVPSGTVGGRTGRA